MKANISDFIQHILAAVVVHGADTKVIASNRTAQELLGLSEDQMLGKRDIDPSWTFLREDGSNMPVEEYPISIIAKTRKQLQDYVVGINRPDRKKPIWVVVNGDLTFDEEGHISYLIISFMDITRLKEMEKEKEQLIIHLKVSLNEIKTLRGLIPICAHCKQVRDDEGLWHQVEKYIHDHYDADFTHGLCPTCASRLIKELD